jgi:hypothetical protein
MEEGLFFNGPSSWSDFFLNNFESLGPLTRCKPHMFKKGSFEIIIIIIIIIKFNHSLVFSWASLVKCVKDVGHPYNYPPREAPTP